MSRPWSRTNRYFVLVLLLLGLIWFVSEAATLVETLAISALLAYILNPAVSFVNRRTRIRRDLVAILVFLVSMATVIGLAIILVPLIPEQTTAILNQITLFQANIDSAPPISFAGIELQVDQLLPDLSSLSTASFIRADIILEAIQAVSTNLGWALVVLVTTYYLLLDWPKLRDWIFRWIPASYNADAQKIYREIHEIWQLYFRGQLRLMIIIGVLTALGAAAIGLDGFIAFGFFAGLFDILLSVGPMMVMVVAVIFAYFTGSTFLPVSEALFAIIVLALFLAIQGIENIWLRPRIMGRTLSMHPAIVFIAIISSLALAGVLVTLIIVPMLASTAVIGRYIYAKMLNIDPWGDELPVSTWATPAKSENAKSASSEFQGRAS